jgi:hypothetical protein
MKKPRTEDTSRAETHDSRALKGVPENERKALELQAHSEHETGPKRERLQKEATKKVD